MRTFLVYPTGYDPEIVTIHSQEDAIERGISDWTPQRTEKMLQLRTKAIPINVEFRSQLPVGVWCEEIFKD
jgi:hypothetical protein